MSDVRSWLESLGLGRYGDAFEENAIEPAQLADLDHEVLEAIGVKAAGHRMRILKAAAALGPPSTEVEPGPGEGSAVSPSTTPPRPGGEAERRQLTVMFCDLVGSTALSEAMDPEEYRELLGSYQSAAKRAIESYDGYIGRYMGDGLLVYFGYPRAHEEDAERAVHAALDVVEAVAGLPAKLGGELRVRVGIATGLVVVGDIIGEGSSEERTVLGDTPNLAARLQGLAAPNEVLLAESTSRLVEGRFSLTRKGTFALKGFADPAPVYQATAVREATRFEAASARGLGQLLGRDEEVNLLLRRWETASAGEGQIVLLGGEPGIGKSRLAEALREHALASGHRLLVFQCSPYHVNSAFHPVIVHIEQAAGIDRRDRPDRRLDKLEALFGPASDGLWLLAELMSLPTDRYVTVDLTPEKRKAETISVLVRHLESLADRSPTLVILEDAHWIDHSTRELFDALTEQVARLPMLLVVTHRPEFAASGWSGVGQTSQLMLNRLRRRDVVALVRSLAGEEDLSDAILEQILERTDGIPLFVEELTKEVLESSGAPEDLALGAEQQIPSSLQDSLVARLDRLGAGKAAAQLGATIGREFPYTLAGAAWEDDEVRLREGLEQLVQAGLLHRRGYPPDASYVFKHALVRDAAYSTLLRQRRRELHARVASALRQHHPVTVQTQPELYAHHLTEAGEIDAALGQWLVAGELAFGRSAAAEAQAHLERGLAIIAVQPCPSDYVRRELALCVALGPVYMTTKGAHAEETDEVYRKARELSERVGDEETQFRVTWGRWHVKQMSGAPDDAVALAEECLTVAARLGGEGYELQAHHAAWSTRFFRGEFASCFEHAERGRELYDVERDAGHRFTYGGHDPGSCCRYFAGMCDWFLGRPDRAWQSGVEAIELARGLDHPFSLVVSLLYAAHVPYLRREPGAVLAMAGEGLALCETHGFPAWRPGLAQLHDWALVAKQGDETAIARMSERVAPERVAGQLLPGNAMFLADGCVRSGDVRRGLAAVESGLTLAEALGHRWVLAEAHRLRAKLSLLAGSGARADAERELSVSLELARAQGARGIELRAAIDLAKLWAEWGDRARALETLGPMYADFRDGHGTPDLTEAKGLIDELT